MQRVNEFWKTSGKLLEGYQKFAFSGKDWQTSSELLWKTNSFAANLPQTCCKLAANYSFW